MTTGTVAEAGRRVREALVAISGNASAGSLPMTCRPPAPMAPFPYGDVVPLGFLLMALEPGSPEHARLTTQLRDRRQGLLWAFHGGTLVTCTDSALVLQGFHDAEATQALETFAGGNGAYVPQLFADEAARGVMQVNGYNRHWCQPDYATTCLVQALRLETGLPGSDATRRYLLDHWERRSGLYFANPYLVDWLLSRALTGAADADPVRQRVAAEILSSRNDDDSFGRYDVPTSTALAVLALSALGHGSDQVRRSRHRLSTLVDADGRCPGGTPFYSTAVVPAERFPPGALARLMLGGRQDQLVWIGGEVHAVSLYDDVHQTISTALAALALSDATARDAAEPAPPVEVRFVPRYRCADPVDYVARHALPPYVGAR